MKMFHPDWLLALLKTLPGYTPIPTPDYYNPNTVWSLDHPCKTVHIEMRRQESVHVKFRKNTSVSCAIVRMAYKPYTMWINTYIEDDDLGRVHSAIKQFLNSM